MTIALKKFGHLLISRPAGKEALLVARAYSLPKESREPIRFDFSGVEVLAPSWADEFLTPLVAEFGRDNISLEHTENQSVQATLRTLKLL